MSFAIGTPAYLIHYDVPNEVLFHLLMFLDEASLRRVANVHPSWCPSILSSSNEFWELRFKRLLSSKRTCLFGHFCDEFGLPECGTVSAEELKRWIDQCVEDEQLTLFRNRENVWRNRYVMIRRLSKIPPISRDPFAAAERSFVGEGRIDVRRMVDECFQQLESEKRDDFDDIPPFKTLFLGDPGAGKCSLLHRALVGDPLSRYQYASTFDGYCLDVSFSPATSFRLKFWVIPHPDSWDELSALVYHDVDCFVLCYDVSDPISFANLRSRWMPEIKKYGKSYQNPASCLMCGNKMDWTSYLEVDGKVPPEDVQAFMTEFDVRFSVGTSAKLGMVRNLIPAVIITSIAKRVGIYQTKKKCAVM